MPVRVQPYLFYEFVELYNTSNTAVDISGWELWDPSKKAWFTFPPSTILQPGAFAVVVNDASGGSPPPATAPNLSFDAATGPGAILNNGGDNLVVYDPVSDSYIQAVYNGDSVDDPTTYAGFSPTATNAGPGVDDFGSDNDGQSVGRFPDGSDSFAVDTPSPGIANVCFADGTMLAVSGGTKRIEDIKVGDLVLTADRGAQKVTWTHSQYWSAQHLRASKKLAPVRIACGALGNGLPNKALKLSQQHRVLVKGLIAERMFGQSEVLIPAKFLLGLPGIDIIYPETGVTYFHILFRDHEIVFSNGIPSESLYLGREAVRSLPQAAVEEIELILKIQLPKAEGAETLMRPVRTFIQGKRARQLVERHAKNERPVLSKREASLLSERARRVAISTLSCIAGGEPKCKLFD